MQTLLLLLYFTQQIFDLKAHFKISVSKLLLSGVFIETCVMMQSLFGACTLSPSQSSGLIIPMHVPQSAIKQKLGVRYGISECLLHAPTQ